MTYFFILGNNPTLSIAEIIKIIKPKEKDIKEITSEFLILEDEKMAKEEEWQSKLGGAVKIGKIIEKIKLDDFKKGILINKIIDVLMSKNQKKINFGFSFYNQDPKNETINKERMALSIKRELKGKNIFSRWVESSEKTLSSVVVEKNILNQGLEIVFLFTQNGVFLGQTSSCQLFKEYGDRDFNRPVRVIKKGMIPPKLARIMINLGGKDEFSIRRTCFLDPFCGTGTILQEAFLMNFGQIIGTDKNKRIIIDAQNNLKWLIQRTKRESEAKKVKIFYSDSRKLANKIKQKSVGLVVTEPYLGPMKFNLSDNQFIVKELARLYFLTFRELKTIIKDDGRVVIVFPVFKIKGREYYIQILEQLKKIGWQTESSLPNFLLKNKTVNITKRNSIIYSRPGQTIMREILVFKLNR